MRNIIDGFEQKINQLKQHRSRLHMKIVRLKRVINKSKTEHISFRRKKKLRKNKK